MKTPFRALAALSAVLLTAACAPAAIPAPQAPQLTYSEEDQSYVLASAAGDQLLIARDFSRDPGMGGDMGTMESPDLEVDVDLTPFTQAGLDPSKLTKTDSVQYLVEEQRFMVHFNWGQDRFTIPADKALADQLAGTWKQIAAAYPQRITGPDKAGLYTADMGDGNSLVWGKELTVKLNAAALKAAGADATKVEGWTLSGNQLTRTWN